MSNFFSSCLAYTADVKFFFKLPSLYSRERMYKYSIPKLTQYRLPALKSFIITLIQIRLLYKNMQHSNTTLLHTFIFLWCKGFCQDSRAISYWYLLTIANPDKVPLPCFIITFRKRMMTFELGLSSTWRFPRFSALDMLLRASASTFMRTILQLVYVLLQKRINAD